MPTIAVATAPVADSRTTTAAAAPTATPSALEAEPAAERRAGGRAGRHHQHRAGPHRPDALAEVLSSSRTVPSSDGQPAGAARRSGGRASRPSGTTRRITGTPTPCGHHHLRVPHPASGVEMCFTHDTTEA